MKHGVKKLNKNETSILFDQLASLTRSGFSTPKALDTISRYSKGKLKVVSSILLEDINAGYSLSEAIAKHPSLIRDYSAQISGGEKSARFSDTLDAISNQLTAQMDAIRNIRGIMVYPATVFVISIVIGMFLLTTVVPQMEEILNQFNTDLPPLTIAVLGVSKFLRTKGFILLAVIIAIIIIMRYLDTHQLKYQHDKFVLKIPVFGKIIYQTLFSVIFQDLGFMLSSGIAVVPALEETLKVSNNLKIKHAIKEVIHLVKDEGQDISLAFKQVNCLNAYWAESLIVGNQSGKIAETFTKLAAILKKDNARKTKKITSMMDPIMLVIIGGFVAIILFSIYLPMFKMMQSIK